MDELEKVVVKDSQYKLGSVSIAKDVVRDIAGLTATDVPGVAGLSGGVVGGIVERLGRKNVSRGVKVDVGEKEAALDIYVVVEFEHPIPEVAVNIQQQVKAAVEKMTGLSVVEVNIHVQDVSFEEDSEDRVK